MRFIIALVLIMLMATPFVSAASVGATVDDDQVVAYGAAADHGVTFKFFGTDACVSSSGTDVGVTPKNCVPDAGGP